MSLGWPKAASLHSAGLSHHTRPPIPPKFINETVERTKQMQIRLQLLGKNSRAVVLDFPNPDSTQLTEEETWRSNEGLPTYRRRMQRLSRTEQGSSEWQLVRENTCRGREEWQQPTSACQTGLSGETAITTSRQNLELRIYVCILIIGPGILG